MTQDELQCDSSLGDVCSAVTCQNCPYCQVRGKVMCGSCDKCAREMTLSVLQFEHGLCDVFFSKMVIMDPSQPVSVRSFEIKDDALKTALLGLFAEYKDTENQLIGKSELEQTIEKVLDPQKLQTWGSNVFVFEFSTSLLDIDLLGSKVSVRDASLESLSFSDFIAEKEEEAKNTLSTKMAAFDQTGFQSRTADARCPAAVAHYVKITPENIKFGINGVLEEPHHLLLVSDLECASSPKRLSDAIKEFSISLVAIIIGKLLQEILFSLLNNKDVLDLVRYDSFAENQKLVEIGNFFSTFNCHNFDSIYTDLHSIRSSIAIKSLFIRGFAESVELFLQVEPGWAREYLKQLYSSPSRRGLDGFACKYHFIFPEYCVGALFGLLVVVDCLMVLRRLLTRKSDSRRPRLLGLLVYCRGVLADWLMSAMLFVYFYNLVSFCLLLKLIKTLNFGLVDYVIMTVRSSIICFPLLEFLKNVNVTGKRLSPRAKENVSSEAKPKTSKVYEHTFTKNFTTKRVHGFWRRTKDRIKIFVRVLFLQPSNSVPKPKRKTLFLKYNLRVIESKSRKSKKRTRGKANCRQQNGTSDARAVFEEHFSFYRDVLLRLFPVHEADCHRAAAAQNGHERLDLLLLW